MVHPQKFKRLQNLTRSGRRIAQIDKETEERGYRKLGRRKDQIARRSPDKRILRGFSRRHRLPQGDLRSRKTGKHVWLPCPFSYAQGNLTPRSSATARNVRENHSQTMYTMMPKEDVSGIHCCLLHKPTTITEAMIISSSQSSRGQRMGQARELAGLGH